MHWTRPFECRSGVIIPTRYGDYDLTVWEFEAYLSKIDMSGGPDACWPWLGARTGNGKEHGRWTQWVPEWGVKVETTAHRVAWAAHNGPIPAGKMVRHRCPGPDGPDPLCQNWRHLTIGTAVDNGRDAARDGVLLTKLTEEQVLEARQIWALGEVSWGWLARRYGVGKSTIKNAVLGKSWAHLPLIGRG